MKRSKLVVTLTCAIALCVAASAATAGTQQDTIDTTIPFTSGSRLEVENTNGEIEIVTWDREEVRIEARKKARSSSDEDLQAALDSLEVIIDESPGEVTIKTRFPGHGVRGWARNRVSLSVDYRITVPKEADLDLETVNGKVDINGIRGDLNIDTTNGGIIVTDSGGRVSAESTNGGISVELAELKAGEDMSFTTTNGGIKLFLPTAVRASLVARTTNGSIQTDFPITAQGNLSRTRLEGDINGGGGKIEIRTTNGGIQITEL